VVGVGEVGSLVVGMMVGVGVGRTVGGSVGYVGKRVGMLVVG
jgi:hypothetical protein